MRSNKRILVAPLNWGLGHATRCIPIIRALKAHHYTPIIASDGVALVLLQKEFPDVETIELPSYKITYAKKKKHFKLKILWDSPKMIKAVKKEKKLIKKLIKEFQLDGIISDNRLGVYSKKIPSVFITHQLNVLSGKTTWMSSKAHQKIIRKFNACWVPDHEGKPNLSGKLGHLKNSKLPIVYLGPLSRLQKKALPFVYDLMVLLSGPEPQRSLLEEKIKEELQHYHGRVLFVRGVLEKEQKTQTSIEEKRITTYYNYMNSHELEIAINESALVLCRSGYTTIMDLAHLEKDAFFIPTPGQYEQEYLAKRMQKLGYVGSATQEDFSIATLESAKDFKGLKKFNATIDYASLFSIFSKVNENSEPTSSTLST
ncbi:glycosyltransferase [Spongiimicrobium salis]|uniref:glycosyltransferase n=1 Tax=Spongiimicrobium salis TaxID=1667022 RepID=UPI00374D77A6